MTESNARFEPDWASPPGETILDLIEERGWTQSELAQRLGYTEKHVSQLLNGKVALSQDAAQRLHRVLGSTVDFWMAREANYRGHLARLSAAAEHASWVSWLDQLPVKELMATKAIATQRLVEKDKPSIVEDCLAFFGVASPAQWQAHYGGMQVAFRRSRPEQSHLGAISAWLRLGERQAESFDGPSYDRARLMSAMREIRRLTREPAAVFGPRLRELLHDAGVAFVLVPSIPRAHVSGVARWLNATRPLIQLSLYGKSNDKFWFTLFHEAAHILLHAQSRQDRQSVYLDDPNSCESADPQEHEANQWAADQLIPPTEARDLVSLKSKQAVTAFADRIGVHAGIVVGRLQHEKLIDPSWFNDLKVRFQLTTHDE